MGRVIVVAVTLAAAIQLGTLAILPAGQCLQPGTNLVVDIVAGIAVGILPEGVASPTTRRVSSTATVAIVTVRTVVGAVLAALTPVFLRRHLVGTLLHFCGIEKVTDRRSPFALRGARLGISRALVAATSALRTGIVTLTGGVGRLTAITTRAGFPSSWVSPLRDGGHEVSLAHTASTLDTHLDGDGSKLGQQLRGQIRGSTRL